MKKVAVVYSSKFGHTKQYADWLKGDLDDVDVINISGFSPTQLLAYKLIIFACGVYGDKLSVMDFIKKNLSAINPQKIMIMAISWYTNDSEEATRKLIEDNYPEQFKNVVPMYVVNSGIDKKKVSPMDTMKLLAAQVMIEKKDGRSSDDINTLAILKGYSDQTSKDNLASIKKGIEEYFNPTKKESPAPEPKSASVSEVKPAPVPEVKPSVKPASEPVQERPVKPMDVSEMKSDADALSSLENAFKALKAPKPAATVKSEPEPAPVSISEPEPVPVSVPEPRSVPVSVPEPEPAPVSIPEPESVPVSVSEPEPAPVSIPEPESVPVSVSEPEPAPVSIPEPVKKTESKPNVDEIKTSIASSANDAIKMLDSGNMTSGYAAVPSFEVESESENEDTSYTYSEEKPVSSIGSFDMSFGMDAVEADEDKIEEVTEIPVISNLGTIDLSADIEESADEVPPEPVLAAEPEPEPVNETVSEPVPKADEHTPRKNSYMELFAKRRRAAVSTEETVSETVSEPASEPIIEAKPELVHEEVQELKTEPVQKPVSNQNTTDVISDFDFILESSPKTTAPAAQQVNNKAIDSVNAVDMDVYDFMSDGSKPAVSSRVMNAVQDLAKAKAEAEKEAAKLAAESKQQQADVQLKAQENDIIEKMKHDIEALAEESVHEIQLENEQNNFVQSDDTTEDDGLDAFDFTNDVEYDLNDEIMDIDPPKLSDMSSESKESKTDFDIRKLQDEINASIETNRVTKEKMMARYGKKQKEEYHNPFAVQFEEDESKGKKKKKEAEHKRLADPIDPDIFFSRPGKDYDMNTDSMPEIKFRKK